MGKYDSFFPSSTHTGEVNVEVGKISVLTKIANELAEANRLKRLELRILSADMDIPKTMQEASEDRA